jgi:hypothetical protein
MLSPPQRIRSIKRMLQHGSFANESTILLRDWLAHPSMSKSTDPLAIPAGKDY